MVPCIALLTVSTSVSLYSSLLAQQAGRDCDRPRSATPAVDAPSITGVCIYRTLAGTRRYRRRGFRAICRRLCAMPPAGSAHMLRRKSEDCSDHPAGVPSQHGSQYAGDHVTNRRTHRRQTCGSTCRHPPPTSARLGGSSLPAGMRTPGSLMSGRARVTSSLLPTHDVIATAATRPALHPPRSPAHRRSSTRCS